MSMAVLYPQNCLKDDPQIRRNTGRGARKQPGSRRQSRSKSGTNCSPRAPKTLVMGQVKILQRGQNLPELLSKQSQDAKEGSVLGESGPVAIGFYAGSAVVSSPPPSSLPLPAFFTKKSAAPSTNDDVATNLRRILGLSLS